MNIEKYRSVSGWYKAMKTEGYEIPLALYHTLNKMTGERGMALRDAYEDLANQGKIEIVGKIIKFHLNEK